MSVTLATIRTQVRSNLDEPATSAADWSDTELNRVINQRYHQVVGAVIDSFEDYYITTALFNTVANQQEYTTSDGLPTDVFKLRRVELNYNPSSSSSAPTRCLPITTVDAVRRDLGYTNSGLTVRSASVANYYTFGFGSSFKMGFIPIPSQSGTSAIKIWYIPTQIDLASDSSTINIPYPEKYYRIIADGATADALRFGQQDTPESDKLNAKFMGDLANMQEELEDKIAEESKGVMDVVGDNLDFTGGY